MISSVVPGTPEAGVVHTMRRWCTRGVARSLVLRYSLSMHLVVMSAMAGLAVWLRRLRRPHWLVLSSGR